MARLLAFTQQPKCLQARGSGGASIAKRQLTLRNVSPWLAGIFARVSFGVFAKEGCEAFRRGWLAHALRLLIE
jgi:hypothetical protein